MKKLINELYSIICDYRKDEDDTMSKERIETWINNFAKEDQIFVLEELIHIFKQRYISQKRAIEILRGHIEMLTKELKYDSTLRFLKDCYFLEIQPEGKSQKILLELLDKILKEEYGISISECNNVPSKFFIYLDDILCTGDTLMKNLTKNEDDSKGWFYHTDENGLTNLDLFKKNKSQLILIYFAIHKLNMGKKLKSLEYLLNIRIMYGWEYEIENDIDNPDSKLDFIFPSENIKDKAIQKCQKQIEEKIHGKGYHLNEQIKYRADNRPKTESLFSSVNNRNRFEKIVLSKSIELYNHSSSLKNNIRAKPLGYGLFSELSLGFGTLFFTWRNVPFNVPLVFWYQDGWVPLFKRNFSTYTKPHKFITLKK